MAVSTVVSSPLQLPMIRPLRICMLTHSVYARDVRIRRYAEYLSDEGHSVDIICMASESNELQSTVPAIRVYPIPMKRNRKEGIRLAINWLISLFYMFLYVSALDLKKKYDLVHVHNMPDFLIFAALIPKLRGTPILLNVHDPMPEIAQSKLGLSPDHFLIRVQNIIEKVCAWFADIIITASPAFKTILVMRGVPENKIYVIMNAADPRFFSLPGPPKRDRRNHRSFTLLYVGTVARRYGLEVALKALPKLRREIPEIRLEVYPKIRNEGKALDECIELAIELDVNDIFIVNDPAPLELMPTIMREADIGIYPAFKDCHMDIALSLKIPEMIGVGLPIVASRLSVLEELYGEEAIAFVDPGSVDSFADKIMELYRNPDALNSLSKHAVAKSQVLTWDSQYSIYLGILRKIFGRPVSRADAVQP